MAMERKEEERKNKTKQFGSKKKEELTQNRESRGGKGDGEGRTQ